MWISSIEFMASLTSSRVSWSSFIVKCLPDLFFCYLRKRQSLRSLRCLFCYFLSGASGTPKHLLDMDLSGGWIHKATLLALTTCGIRWKNVAGQCKSCDMCSGLGMKIRAFFFWLTKSIFSLGLYVLYHLIFVRKCSRCGHKMIYHRGQSNYWLKGQKKWH